LVAPFIAAFVLEGPVQPCRLLECGSCRLRFFSERFTTDELHKLYAEYRGDRYYRIRHRHEPWYTETYNRWIGHDAQRTAARKDSLRAFLHKSGVFGPFEAILDYGGDAGQLIPQELTQHGYVFDLSGVAPVPGVDGIANTRDLRPQAYDLILMSHVLEHVPDPVDLLRHARGLVRESGFLYVEVPLERPWMGFVGRGFAMRLYLDLLRRNSVLLRWVDFYSSAFRVKAGTLPPFGFPKLHEHINCFSVESLSAAVDRSGFDVLRIAPTSTAGPDQTADSIACVARAKRTPGFASNEGRHADLLSVSRQSARSI
jgi:SAM-dependent methyltransferase